MRGAKRKGTRYFGPYAHAWAIRETVDLLLRVFPCAPAARRLPARRADRPALPARLHRQVLGALRRPGRPPRSTAGIVEDFCDFMAGADRAVTCGASSSEMRQAAADLRLRAGRPAARRPRRAASGRWRSSAVVLRRRHRRRRRRPRRRRARGRRPGLPRARRPDPRPARLGRREGRGRHDRATSSSTCCCRSTATSRARRRPARGARARVARRSRARASSEWLSGRRGGRGRRPGAAARATSGRSCETVARNADAGARRCTRRGAPGTSPPAARPSRSSRTRSAWPRRRCGSSASTSPTSQGTDVVASMVVFEDGLPRKGGVPPVRRPGRRHGAETTSRPIARGDHPAVPPLPRRAERTGDLDLGGGPADGVPAGGASRAPSPRPRRSTRRRAARDVSPTRPNLVVVDGGQPQVAAAAACPRRARRRRRRARAASPSGSRRSGSPATSYPVILPRTSEGLYLLQRVRDEAHRFAITYHRQRREQGDDGERARRRPGPRSGAHEGAAAALRLGEEAARTASVEEIAAVPGIGPALAAAVAEALPARRAGSDGASPWTLDR